MDSDVTCPWCSNVNSYDEAFLGLLGFLSHYRCRYCGGNFTNEGCDDLSREASYFDQGGEA